MKLRALDGAVLPGLFVDTREAPLPVAAFQPGLSTLESASSQSALYAGSLAPNDSAFNRFDLTPVPANAPLETVAGGAENASVTGWTLAVPVAATAWLLLSGTTFLSAFSRRSR